MNGAVGFGIAPPGSGPKGLRADQPPPSQSDDLHAIRTRFCLPKSIQRTPVSLAANAAQRVDCTGTPLNAFILTCTVGQINVYLGDNTTNGGKPALTPDFVLSAAIAPETMVIPLPPAADYIFTLQEGAAAAGGCAGTFIPIAQ